MSEPVLPREDIYESDRLLGEYLLLHYGNAKDTFGDLPGPDAALDFPGRCVDELIDDSRIPSGARALDIGCAVGRSSIELRRRCTSVLGIDRSANFVNAAARMLRDGAIPYSVPVEGAFCEERVAKIPQGLPAGGIQFSTGDAMYLPSELAGFDVVLAANLICRLPQPPVFLSRLPSLVAEGGQLLLATPFSWLEEFTSREHWPAGRGVDALREALSPHFDLDFSVNLPFVIREHARKFQYGVSLGTRWIRRQG